MPSMAAQQSDGPAVPTIVTDTEPAPVFVVVVSPARRVAVTDVVDTNVRVAWIPLPALVQVKETPVTPNGGVLLGPLDPPNRDSRPQPARAMSMAKIPIAPMSDIERIPTAPPAEGSRWRPTPGSIFIARQDKRTRSLVERPRAESRTDGIARGGSRGARTHNLRIKSPQLCH